MVALGVAPIAVERLRWEMASLRHIAAPHEFDRNSVSRLGRLLQKATLLTQDVWSAVRCKEAFVELASAVNHF
jgi:hypothetical protein